MGRASRFSSVAIAILLIAAILSFLWTYRAFMFPDQTLYAVGFSNDKWGQLKIGMTEKDVISILGKPLEISEKGTEGIYRVVSFQGDLQFQECYYNLPPSLYDPNKIDIRTLNYSRPGKWIDSYNKRLVKIDQSGRVVEIQSERYWD
jgi:outer membrane protein assembly factor BamE (lipoprotein component of BamABCDE complex)